MEATEEMALSHLQVVTQVTQIEVPHLASLKPQHHLGATQKRSLYWFPIAAVTNHHNISGSKMIQKCYLTVPEVRSLKQVTQG